MKFVEEKLLKCGSCNKITRHLRNNKKINWIMHLVLIILTVGVWIIPMFLVIFLGVDLFKEKFFCEICGEKYLTKADKVMHYIFLSVVGIFLFLLVIGLVFG